MCGFDLFPQRDKLRPSLLQGDPAQTGVGPQLDRFGSALSQQVGGDVFARTRESLYLGLEQFRLRCAVFRGGLDDQGFVLRIGRVAFPA